VNGARAALVPGTLDVLAGTPTVMRGLLAALPADVATRPADGDWSPRDVLAHVLSVEPWALARRVRLMLDEDDPPVPEVDEGEALARSGLRERPAGELLEQFERARRGNLTWLRRLSAGELARSGRHAQVGTITVANVLHHVAFHDLGHVRQLAAMLEPAYHEGRGRMRDAY
jgi:hypothetical protein